MTEAVYGGPDNSYLQDFEATFEQHCEGGEPALRGTVSIHNPPAPEPLELGLGVAGDGTFSRVNGRAIVTGPISLQVACAPGAPVPAGGRHPNRDHPVPQGDAEAEVSAFAQDPNFGTVVTARETQVVRLRRA